MRTFFIILTCVAFAGWSLWARYHYTCKIHNLCGEVSTLPGVDDAEALANSLSLNIDGKPVLTGYEHFKYDLSTVDPKLSDNNTKFLDDLAAWLKANPNAKVKVSGNYLPDEKVKGIYETAGLARANKIRELLVARGVNPDQLNIDSDPLAAGLDLSKPLGFSGTGGDGADVASKEVDQPKEGETADPDGKAKEEEKLVEAKFEFKNMTFSDVSFEVGSAKFEPVSNFVSYADSVSRYLVDHPNQKLTIIGHTDSDGESSMNMDLGMRRAKSVRDYFMKKHKVSRSRINTETKGETQPVAPNDTDGNKRKNRRVNMQLG